MAKSNFFYKYIYLAVILTAFNFHVEAQNKKFTKDMLNNPKQYASEFEKLFNINEIKKYDTTENTKNKVILENGYAQSSIKNKSDWKAYQKNIVITQIDIIYTKYPKNKNFWRTNYYELLANRIKELFKLDSTLNSNDFEWNIILQTDCNNEAETMKMFHGICIHYFEEDKFEKEENSNIDIKKPDSITLNNYTLKVKNFIQSQGGLNDSLVFKTFNQHPEWKNALVVMDWTGSMYQYGAQAILWHTMNFETSGIKNFVFFNDGDGMPDIDKKIGSTGGVYFAQANNLDRLLKTFYLVEKRGKGGDPEENDIEGILKGINRFQDFDEVILIADNNSCMRDFQLISNIGVKVNIIDCGSKYGINPQYINLAYLTGGSVFSMEEAIDNISKKINGKSLDLKKLTYELDSENLFQIKNQNQKIRFSDCDQYTHLYPTKQDNRLSFIDKHGEITDSSVYKILDRHPLWTNSAVIMDWSQEVYTQSAQAILWNKNNQKSTGIKYFCFTNDGDKLLPEKKKIGKTLGIYFIKSNNLPQVEKKCFYVEKKGNGGNDNENNLFEATLATIKKYPNTENIVVIANNESSSRDFKLIKYLNTPIKVVLTNVKGPINPQYINMAYKSGGSLHLIDEDYYNFVFQGVVSTNAKLILNGVSYILNKNGYFDFEDEALKQKFNFSVNTKKNFIL